MIGFVPENTHVDDLICQFKGSSSVAVVRRIDDTERYEIVGRAVTFNPSVLMPFRCQALNSKVKHRDVVEWPIVFRLDIPTLQLLTEPASLGSCEKVHMNS